MTSARSLCSALLGAAALALLAASACTPRPRIVTPADQSATALDGATDVRIVLASEIAPPGSYRITLLRGIDAPPAATADLTARFVRSGDIVSGALGAADLAPGRNALFVSVDADGDGRPDNVMSSTFRWDPLRAAACKRVITPVVGENHGDPIYMAGFSNDRQPLGVHDDIWARGYVVQNADKKIGVVTLDVIGYFNNEVRTIREDAALAGLGFDAIVVTSTHNHEGPDTMGLWGEDETQSGVDLGYLDFVNAKVVECLVEANANLEPAEMRFATGSTVGASLAPWPDLVADGRVLQPYVIPGSAFTPPRAEDVVVQGDAGPVINPAVPALQIRSRASGAVLATVANYASHPEALGSGNRLITSDFPHFMREALEARYGGVAIYQSADLGVLQGPLDVDVIDPATGEPAERRTFRFAQVMGEALAERTSAALEAAPGWDANPALDARTSGSFLLAVENPFFRIAAGFGVFGRRQLERDDQRRPAVSTEVNVLRIGPAQMAVTPNELDPQIGYAYRDLMTGAEHRWLLGLGNDEVGYQMPAEKFNPSCHECFSFVVFGDVADCPIAQALGEDAVDCDTIFINNLGAGADGVLQGEMRALLEELNAP
ncbi:MAG: hypothetical protein DCC71_21010 [Proteobacteria bacterium]|nr:MAG: hypothetical protein DCC71_21010 [Pseudomonadota bacterium]